MRRRFLQGLLVALGAVLVSGWLGCGARDTRPLIGLTLPSSSHPFFVYIKRSVLEEAQKLDVRVVSVDAEDDPARQLAIVEGFIAQGVNGVVMAPVKADALVGAVEALNRAKIPVATVDRQVTGGEVLVHVGADNVEGGRVAARYLLKRVGKGKVLQLEGTPGASPTTDRKRGFEETLAGTELKIVASQTADFKRATGQTVMEGLLQVHSDFQAVFAANDEMILGALEAPKFKEIPADKVVTMGYDVIVDAAEAIRAGRLTASIEQYPGRQARQALGHLVAFVREGRQPPNKEIYLTPIAVDRSNLDQAERKEP